MELEKIEDMVIADLLGLLLIFILILLPGFGAFRIPLGVTFLMFFPGYSIVSALFTEEDDLSSLERVALSLGLSLAVMPLIGMVLNYTPFGLRLYPVTVSFYLLMLAMTWVTYYRRKELSDSKRFEFHFQSSLPDWGEVETESKVLVIGSVIVVIVAGLTGYFFGPSHRGEGFTSFYILGSGGKLENYPTDLRVGENEEIIVGITNHEYERENYRVLATLENDQIKNIEGIELGHGENWSEKVPFTAPQQPGENIKLQFHLYRGENAEPWKMTQLLLTVRP